MCMRASLRKLVFSTEVLEGIIPTDLEKPQVEKEVTEEAIPEIQRQ